MPFLADANLIALVTAEHIDQKVYARLPEACSHTKADVADATAAYEQLHRPHLRLVRVGDLMTDDERVGQVALADSEDRALAQLGVLLAPALVLTEDKAILAAGIGVREWGNALKLLKDLIELEALMWSAADGVALGSAITIHTIDGLIKLRRRSEVALGLTAGLAIGALLMYRDQLRSLPTRLKRGAGPAFEKLFTELAHAGERWEDADNLVHATLVRRRTDDTLEAAVASVLLQDAEPASAAMVHARIAYGSRPAEVGSVMAVLRAQPAFELVRGRGWTLGHHAGT